jgi:hypothetical protein
VFVPVLTVGDRGGAERGAERSQPAPHHPPVLLTGRLAPAVPCCLSHCSTARHSTAQHYCGQALEGRHRIPHSHPFYPPPSPLTYMPSCPLATRRLESETAADADLSVNMCLTQGIGHAKSQLPAMTFMTKSRCRACSQTSPHLPFSLQLPLTDTTSLPRLCLPSAGHAHKHVRTYFVVWLFTDIPGHTTHNFMTKSRCRACSQTYAWSLRLEQTRTSFQATLEVVINSSASASVPLSFPTLLPCSQTYPCLPCNLVLSSRVSQAPPLSHSHTPCSPQFLPTQPTSTAH